MLILPCIDGAMEWVLSLGAVASASLHVWHVRSQIITFVIIKRGITRIKAVCDGESVSSELRTRPYATGAHIKRVVP